MKRILLSLIAFCAMTTAFANDEQFATSPTTVEAPAPATIVGTWKADAKKLINDPAIKNANLYLTFSSTKATISIDIQASEQSTKLEMGIKLGINGTYKKDGNKLKITPSSKPTVKVYKLNASQEIKDQLSAAGMSLDSLKQMIEQQAQQGNQFDGVIDNFNESLTITKLTSTTLVLTDETGQSVTFTRTK